MYARLITVQGRPDKLDAGILSWQEQLLPGARTMPGFQGVYLPVDREAGRALPLSF